MDSNAEWPDIKPGTQQKYKVGDKEYTVSTAFLEITYMVTPFANSSSKATGAYYEFAVNLNSGGTRA